MGFLSALFGTGSTGRDAANDQYQKEVAAIGQLQGFADQYPDRVRANYAPYGATGQQSNSLLSGLISNPDSLRTLPGYQFSQDEGLKALQRSGAARHLYDSGRMGKDILRFSQGLADKTYGDQLGRLLGVTTGLGLPAAAAGAAGEAGRLGALQTAFGGQLKSAGTQGQGAIADAQRQSDAITQLLGLAGYVGGKALGGGIPGLGGSSFGGGGDLFSAMSGAGNAGWGAPLSAGVFV